jgi:sortase (surface protein transpeptidase)
MVRTPRALSDWRAYWDPESEVLVLTLTSAVLAGIGVALILMGAMPATVPTSASAATLPGGGASSGPVVTREPTGRPAKARPAKNRTLGRSLPRTLDIPAIGVHTSVMSLGLQSDGTVEVPPLQRDAPAGWYKNLSTPGEPGPAVILGHVDSAREGPAVFYRLRELRPGDRLSVGRADGRTVHFVVRSVARYPKKDFPTAAVYGPRPGAELRLVTCGGSFDALRRHYRDNIVVYAAMTSSSAAKKHRNR